MWQIRIHGRGGQGVVTAAELLSFAAFDDGHEAQAFPSFGSERMGAPVVAFCRISDVPIRVREPVSAPDAVIVIDSTLLHHVDLFAGLADRGYVLLNSTHLASELGLEDLTLTAPGRTVVTVPGTELARRHLGRPLPNVCLLGAFAALTGAVSFRSIEAAVRGRFPEAVADANIAAAAAGYRAAGEVLHA
jgi:pyruvate ferredoxin oxidoreductase gamma subunit